MTVYKGFDINTVGTPKPWGAREEQAWKDAIDTLVADTVDVYAGKRTAGHRHNSFYDGYGTKIIECGTSPTLLIGGTAGKQTVITVPQFDGTFKVKTIDGYSAIQVDDRPGNPKKITHGRQGTDYIHEIGFGYNQANAFRLRGIFGYDVVKVDALNGYIALKALQGAGAGPEMRLTANGEFANTGEEWVDYALGHDERFHGWDLTGFAERPRLYYKRVGKVLHVRVWVDRDSNDTDTWFDLPYTPNAPCYSEGSFHIAPIATWDYTANRGGWGSVRWDGIHYYVDVLPHIGGGQWSNTGRKHVEGSFTVPIV